MPNTQTKQAKQAKQVAQNNKKQCNSPAHYITQRWCDVCNLPAACVDCQMVAMDRLVCIECYDKILCTDIYNNNDDENITDSTLSIDTDLFPKEIFWRFKIDTPSA